MNSFTVSGESRLTRDNGNSIVVNEEMLRFVLGGLTNPAIDVGVRLSKAKIVPDVTFKKVRLMFLK